MCTDHDWTHRQFRIVICIRMFKPHAYVTPDKFGHRQNIIIKRICNLISGLFPRISMCQGSLESFYSSHWTVYTSVFPIVQQQFDYVSKDPLALTMNTFSKARPHMFACSTKYREQIPSINHLNTLQTSLCTALYLKCLRMSSTRESADQVPLDAFHVVQGVHPEWSKRVVVS
jgi:hypothetical protein